MTWVAGFEPAVIVSWLTQGMSNRTSRPAAPNNSGWLAGYESPADGLDHSPTPTKFKERPHSRERKAGVKPEFIQTPRMGAIRFWLIPPRQPEEIRRTPCKHSPEGRGPGYSRAEPPRSKRTAAMGLPASYA